MKEGVSEVGSTRAGKAALVAPEPTHLAAAAAELAPVRLPRIDLRAIFLIKALAHALLAVELWAINLFVGEDLIFRRIVTVIAVQVAASLTIAFRPGPAPRPLLAFSLFVDILVVSAWVHVGGGTEVVAAPTAYVLVIGLAGILLSPNAAFACAAGSVLGYALVIWAEYEGYLPHRAPYTRPPEVQARIVAFVSFGALLPAVLVAYAVVQLRETFAQAHRESIAALHELAERLGGPLREIRAHAQEILRAAERTANGSLTRILAAAQEAGDLTRNILDLARIEREAAKPHLQDLDTGALLHQACDYYAPAAKLRRVHIGVKVEAGATRLRGDRELLARALANLTSNAVKFTPEGGTVMLSARRSGDEVVLSVRDQGPSITAADVAHLFERPHWSSDRAGGHAHMGLFLVRCLADIMGARVSVEPEAERGNVFSITVPDTPAVVRRESAVQRQAGGISTLPEPSLRLVHGGKAVALGSMIGIAWLLRLFLDPSVAALPMSALLVPSTVLGAAVALWRGPVPVPLIAASIASDILCVLGGTHAMGGVEVVAGPMFLAAIIGVAGFVLTERAALATAAFCIAGYAALVWAEYAGVLPHHSPNLRPPDRQLAAVLLVGGSLAATGAVVSYAVRQMRNAFHGAQVIRIEAVNALSHDLKNPLHVVLGYASLLEHAEVEERAEFAGFVAEAAERALSLVRGGLDVSAWQEGALAAPRLAPVQLNELVKQTAARFRLAAAERDLRLVTKLAPDLPLVGADAELLERAIANLISNGIKYGGSGGLVEVSTAHDHAHVAIAVRDEGQGLQPAEQARLFQKFSRTDSALGIEGTGLGLYIVRTILEAHGGSVHVDSAVGRGSTFTLQLPKQR